MTINIRSIISKASILHGLIFLSLVSPLSLYAEDNQPANSPSYSLWGAQGKTEEQDNQPVELGLKFRSDVDGSVNAVRFYRTVADSSGYKVNIWSATGELLGTGKASEGQGPIPGWQVVQIYPPVTINAGKTYVASYYASKGQYYSSANYFNNIRINNGPLHAVADGEEGGNGVYKYGEGGGFPAESYNASNYWIDVNFTPAKAP